jgi:C-terminal processing protease CtpA/Prc
VFTELKYCVSLVFLFSLVGLSVADDLRDDRRRAENILNQISQDVHDTFYDPNLKGLDWAALTEQARERIRNAKNTGQMYGAISALLFQLHDSHTSFLPPRRRLRAIYGFKAQPFGENIFVYEVDPDGPAAKAGLRVGDQIIGINNLNTVRPTFGDMMRYLTFIDPREELDVEVQNGPSSHIIKIPVKLIPITRDVLESDMEEEKHPYTVHDFGDGVVSLQLKTFGVGASEIKAMTKQARGAKAVVLDLRGNSGGLEDTVVELMNRLSLEPYEIGKNVSRRKPFALVVKPDSSHLSCPLFVLIDSGSASGSEIAARSLQLHKRAVIFGDRSSGSVEAAHFFWRLISFGDRIYYGTEIAFSKFVMENGEELENRGVTPDQMCIPGPTDLRDGKDPCLDQALARARAAIAGQIPTGVSR